MAEEPEGVLLPYIDRDLAVAIARAISAWARFEFEIDEFIWQLASLEPEDGACLTAQFQTVAVRFNALVALARVHGIQEGQIKRLNAIRRRADRLAEKRNRLVHDPWFYGYRSEVTYRLQRTARAKLIHQYEIITIDDLQHIETTIDKLIKDFVDLRDDIHRASWSSS